MTPDLYTIVIAAKQVVRRSVRAARRRDGRRISLPADTGLTDGPDGHRSPATARRRDRRRRQPPARATRVMAIAANCSAGPTAQERQRWQMQWNPISQCSWPPEDELIEDFRTHVIDRAKQIMGADLGADREVHDQHQGRHRYPRHAAALAHRRHLRQESCRPAVARWMPS